MLDWTIYLRDSTYLLLIGLQKKLVPLALANLIFLRIHDQDPDPFPRRVINLIAVGLFPWLSLARWKLHYVSANFYRYRYSIRHLPGIKKKMLIQRE